MSSGVFDLPVVLISDILCRLPVEEVKRCRCVCRTFHDLIKEPQFLYDQQRRGIMYPVCHLLQTNLDTEKGVIKNATYIINKSRTTDDWRTKEVQQVCGTNFKDARILGSCNGLLLVSTGVGAARSIFVYNLILRDGLRLPNPPHGLGKNGTGFGIGFDKVTKSYKVVLAYTSCSTYDYGHQSYGEILTVGENTWRELHFPHLLLIGNLKPVFLNQAFYWMFYSESTCYDVDNMILALDANMEKFEIVRFPSSEGKLGITDNMLFKYPVS